jgi:CheY-like chemotaxis protein
MESPPEKKRIALIVDDCSIDNFVNKKMILNYKFADTVQAFQNPLKALEFLRQLGSNETQNAEIPEVLFLDLDMPLLDGHAFLDAYANLPDVIKLSCRIVILSGLIDPAKQSRTIRNQFVIAQMNKPLIKSNLDQIDLLLKGPDLPDCSIRKSA